MTEGRMDKWAFVFPGQGSQKVGMGKDLYEQSSLAKEEICLPNWVLSRTYCIA